MNLEVVFIRDAMLGLGERELIFGLPGQREKSYGLMDGDLAVIFGTAEGELIVLSIFRFFIGEV